MEKMEPGKLKYKIEEKLGHPKTKLSYVDIFAINYFYEQETSRY
jgi:hypothetical protein